MMLSREQTLKTIVDGIAWIESQAKLRGLVHLLDSHVIVQEFFCRLLNELFDLHLVVTDNIHQNFPAIDLGDETGKQCFQVTTELRGEKIQATIDAYVAHDLAGRFGKLRVLVIGKRQRTYNKLRIPPSLPFAWQDDVIDTHMLVQQTSRLPTEKLQRVAAIIRGEIRLPSNEPSGKTRAAQSSKIASCYFPIKLSKASGSDDVDSGQFQKFATFLAESICRCFVHTCVETGIEDFTFLLTLAKSDRETDSGFVPYDLEVVCHVTEFVRTLEQRLEAFMSGTATTVPPLKTLGSGLSLESTPLFGREEPHRLHRVPPNHIIFQHVQNIPSPPGRPMTTSALLCLLSGALKGKVLLWDDADKHVDVTKVMSFIFRTEQHGFSWDRLRLDPENPESWEYDG